jgi:hypothetical protein
VEKALNTRSQINQFVLYANAEARERGFRIVAVDEQGTGLCRYKLDAVALSKIPPSVRLFGRNTKRRQINGIVETPNGMAENGFYPGAFSDPLSLCAGRRIWGSYRQADADVGSIVFDIPDPLVELGLPVVTGPGFGGRMVTLIAGDGAKQELSIDQSVVNSAKLAKLERSDGLPIKKIVIADTGTNWGQWLAVCAPVGIKHDP